MHTPATGRAIRFGPFQLDPRTRELRKGRTRIRVADQSVRILVALLDRAGDVVTREELAAILWPRAMELSAGGRRLVVPVVRPKGSLWMLEQPTR